jgi:D-lactate dehydrogenase
MNSTRYSTRHSTKHSARKIGFFEVEGCEKELLRKAFPKDELFFYPQKINQKNAGKFKDLEVISTFIYSQINDKVLQKMPKLKLVTTRSTGFEHIDLKSCASRGIPVCNVPRYGENTVAEQTFALILTLSRKIIDSVERTRKGSFDLDGLRGFDLKDKTLGVVGTGNIGKYVVRIGQGFGMKVIAFDVCKDETFAKERNFPYVSLEELLKRSDVVTLHVPYNEHTHHLIDKKKISLMKSSALIINTSRGGIIDTNTLVKALKSKKLAGAGLDVLEGECDLIEEWELVCKDFRVKCDMKTLVENHVLLNMPNVIVTPHNAFNTNEALMRILQSNIDSINGFKNKKLINVVKG